MHPAGHRPPLRLPRTEHEVLSTKYSKLGVKPRHDMRAPYSVLRARRRATRRVLRRRAQWDGLVLRDTLGGRREG